MQCIQCGKELGRKALRLRNQNGTPRVVSFCCYEHYVKFWEPIEFFVPLPEYKED